MVLHLITSIFLLAVMNSGNAAHAREHLQIPAEVGWSRGNEHADNSAAIRDYSIVRPNSKKTKFTPSSFSRSAPSAQAQNQPRKPRPGEPYGEVYSASDPISSKTRVPNISVLKSQNKLKLRYVGYFGSDDFNPDATSIAKFDRKKIEELLTKKENHLSHKKNANTIVIDDGPVASSPSKERGASAVPTYSHVGYISPAPQVCSPYLQIVAPEDRQFLVNYLELTFSEVTSYQDLKYVIGNEYSLVENYLATYSPTLQERFFAWDREAGKYSMQKKKVILGALAFSLSELAHRKMVLNHQSLFNDNCLFVLNLVQEVDASKGAITADSIGFKMMKFAQDALK